MSLLEFLTINFRTKVTANVQYIAFITLEKKYYLTWLGDILFHISGRMFGDTFEVLPVFPILFVHWDLTDSSVIFAVQGRRVLNEVRQSRPAFTPGVSQGGRCEVGGQTAESDRVSDPRATLNQRKHRGGFGGRWKIQNKIQKNNINKTQCKKH